MPQCQVERPKRWAMDKRKKTLLVVAAPCRLHDLHTAATLTRPSTRPVRPQSIRKSEQGHLVHRLAGSTIPQERPTNPPAEPQQRQAVVPQPCRIRSNRSSRSSRSRRPVINSRGTEDNLKKFCQPTAASAPHFCPRRTPAACPVQIQQGGTVIFTTRTAGPRGRGTSRGFEISLPTQISHCPCFSTRPQRRMHTCQTAVQGLSTRPLRNVQHRIQRCCTNGASQCRRTVVTGKI